MHPQAIFSLWHYALKQNPSCALLWFWVHSIPTDPKPQTVTSATSLPKDNTLKQCYLPDGVGFLAAKAADG